jgi:hypothetical protein
MDFNAVYPGPAPKFAVLGFTLAMLPFMCARNAAGAVWQKPGDSCSQVNPNGASSWDDWMQAGKGDPRADDPSESGNWTTPGDRQIRETPHGNGAFRAEGPYCRTIMGNFANFYLKIDYMVIAGRVKPKEFEDFPPPDTDQDFGNSGVYIFDRWEVQIIDPSQFDDPNNQPGVKKGKTILPDPRIKRSQQQRNTNVPGALYAVDPVREDNPNIKGDDLFLNQANPAGQWNTLEIWFCAPNGAQKPMLRSDLNGQTVYYGTVAGNGTGTRGNAKPLAQGPIYLQSHWGSDVQFRNPTFGNTACPPPKP